MITIRWACGHTQTIGDLAGDPICPTCGERRVARTTAPAPRFRGVCQGPSATFEALPGMPVHVAPQGPLAIKEHD